MKTAAATLCVIAAVLMLLPAQAQDAPGPPTLGPGESYCRNVANAAADARIEWQKQEIAKLEAELKKRTDALEAKMAEYQKWLARRDEFAAKAQESLVGIYAQMKPDAASAQLAAMDDEAAAAILTKLGVRKASAIMNEMESAKAARLSATIAGAARKPADTGRPPSAAANNASAATATPTASPLTTPQTSTQTAPTSLTAPASAPQRPQEGKL